MTEHWFIPKQEQVELVDALGEVRDILDDLREAQKPRIATATWNPKVTTGDRPQPLPFNVASFDAADRLLIELERWVYWLADARQIAAPNTDCKGYANWLTRNILLLAATPGSEAAHHDITTEIRHARNASGRSHLQPIPKPNPARLAQAHAEQLNARGIATLAKHIGAQGLTIRRINHLAEKHKITPIRYADKKTPIYQLGDILNAHYTTPQRNRIAG
ncbi:hypothetical protein [Rhodococcus sp. (in: high G+C Gram-positive bacteria)]|uniref:hypothetical protein n=1 Tax=Rhodococcus sp. TaxID=1831 RepID=UPI001A1E870E|nr:hypothetical protein [Rhodococcus sp. (in: high G+C Gram-positive bacteria)]MBJ7481751.1 hypothetical protein [Rhodococcus sp. (in: high G+C Gram-positive bacteria)]